MEDREIVDLYLQRSETAVGETAKKYGGLCMRVAYNILGSKADAEECLNDTYLSLWNAIPPAEPANLRNFTCRIARNLSLKNLRHNSAQKRAKEFEVSLSELEDILPDGSITPDTSDEDLTALIGEFLRTLDVDIRNVFIRKYWFFDPICDIAEMYGFSEGKVKSILHRTRGKLKVFLTKKGVRL